MKYSEMKQAAREGRLSVHLHGFQNLPCGSQEYCDDQSKISGWAVYLRAETPNDPQQSFDIHELPDRPTQAEAQSAASQAALTLLNDTEAWDHD